MSEHKARIESQVWEKSLASLYQIRIDKMQYYLGVDVSKEKLDIYFEGEWFVIEQTEQGHEELSRYIMMQNKSIIVICEASGGYEKKFIKFLIGQGIKAHIVQANKVRAFAKAKGLLAKTDKLDAKVIAEFAQIMSLNEDGVLSESAENIRELLKRREQLIADKQRELQRRDKVSSAIKKSLIRHIDWLDTEIKKLDEELESIKQENNDIAKQVMLYSSIPGIGNIISYYLIAYLPELGSLNNKQLAALVGVAPFNRDSGTQSGKRYIQGGRKSLRNHLFMAAIVSIRWNSLLSPFYKKLKESGKPAKVAITAVIRKLLCLLNSIAKRQYGWQKDYALPN